MHHLVNSRGGGDGASCQDKTWSLFPHLFNTLKQQESGKKQKQKPSQLLNVNVHLHVGNWASCPDVEGVLTHHPQDSRASKRSTALDLRCQILLIRWSSSRYSLSLSCWFKGGSFSNGFDFELSSPMCSFTQHRDRTHKKTLSVSLFLAFNMSWSWLSNSKDKTMKGKTMTYSYISSLQCPLVALPVFVYIKCSCPEPYST